jgi:DNA-binding NarL/FixJ family response regulator
MNSPGCRILVVEDQYFFRLALRTTIESRPDMQLVAETDKGEEALELCRRYKPDVVLMDLRLPGISGFEAIERIHRELPGIGILVLSNYEGNEDVHRALSSGALAYLTKDAEAQLLIDAILSVRAGRRFVPPSIGALLAERVPGAELTTRELDVLRLLATGRSNREVGEQLNISENTVRIHVSRILNKLGVTDRTQAVLLALQRGLIHVPGLPKE